MHNLTNPLQNRNKCLMIALWIIPKQHRVWLMMLMIWVKGLKQRGISSSSRVLGGKAGWDLVLKGVPNQSMWLEINSLIHKVLEMDFETIILMLDQGCHGFRKQRPKAHKWVLLGEMTPSLWLVLVWEPKWT